ncbi:unnamed protein product [Staurois parvus]|uniref:Uncharacterized protein n=1 Tax=Staurois parvus TaxID=386267 RepID=A0ABN9EKE6_9NEOB|nr:unnamed protein product [Staurois parvus]
MVSPPLGRHVKAYVRGTLTADSMLKKIRIFKKMFLLFLLLFNFYFYNFFTYCDTCNTMLP